MGKNLEKNNINCVFDSIEEVVLILLDGIMAWKIWKNLFIYLFL